VIKYSLCPACHGRCGKYDIKKHKYYPCAKCMGSGVMVNILYLPIKKQWFDMICDGVKKEEYREINQYWLSRFLNHHYDVVELRNGYGHNAPSARFELKYIMVGEGKAYWGAPGGSVFILKLGKRIYSQ